MDNNLPFQTRLGIWRAGLGTQQDADALISEAGARNLWLYLPVELREEAKRRQANGAKLIPVS